MGTRTEFECYEATVILDSEYPEEISTCPMTGSVGKLGREKTLRYSVANRSPLMSECWS